MTNAELIQAIRSEIERRIEELNKDKYISIDAQVCRTSELNYLLRFLSTLEKSEKPIPKDLEEAASEYAYGSMPDEMKSYVKPVGDEVIKNFIAGAEWQKEQDNAISRQAEAERIKTQQMCYEKGQADMKRKMMQEAVEGEVIKDNRGNNVIRAGVFNKDFEYGDKVRVIVLPKED